jgi:hypothetical protein
VVVADLADRVISIVDRSVGSKFVGAELVGTFAKILGEVGHNPHLLK